MCPFTKKMRKCIISICFKGWIIYSEIFEILKVLAGNVCRRTWHCFVSSFSDDIFEMFVLPVLWKDPLLMLLVLMCLLYHSKDYKNDLVSFIFWQAQFIIIMIKCLGCISNISSNDIVNSTQTRNISRATGWFTRWFTFLPDLKRWKAVGDILLY